MGAHCNRARHCSLNGGGINLKLGDANTWIAITDSDCVDITSHHRFLLTDWHAELSFDEPEVLVAAKHLVNDDTIRVAADLEEFEYFHILFDSHQAIVSGGLSTECFHLGGMAMNSLSEGIENYARSTHTSLRASEAKLQRNNWNLTHHKHRLGRSTC